MPAWPLVLALFLQPTTGVFEITARDLDAQSVEQGLAARLGTPPHGWRIHVAPGATEDSVHLDLRHDDGRTITRDIVLEQTEVDARSRELATVLALLIEQSELPTPTPTGPTPQTEPARTPITGWIGVIGRGALNVRRPVTPDFGALLGGGVWLDDWYVQPVAQVGWSRSRRADLTIDGVRFGAGLLAGAPFARGFGWAGAGAIAHALWARANAERRDAGWFSVTEILGTVQLRGAWWTAGVRVGVDLVLPPLSARGGGARGRWDIARPAFAIVLGGRLPPRKRGPRPN